MCLCDKSSWQLRLDRDAKKLIRVLICDDCQIISDPVDVGPYEPQPKVG